MNRKLLVSKSDTNNVYVWTNDKYKPPQPHPNNAMNFTNTPDIVLLTEQSVYHNYALRFTPSLPRVISASGNKLEMFDLEGPQGRRQLGLGVGASGSTAIKPLLVL